MRDRKEVTRRAQLGTCVCVDVTECGGGQDKRRMTMSDEGEVEVRPGFWVLEGWRLQAATETGMGGAAWRGQPIQQRHDVGNASAFPWRFLVDGRCGG